MEINFFLSFSFAAGLSTRVTTIVPAVHLVQKRNRRGVCGEGGGVILQLMAADSQLYCNHGMTHLEEIALHIALPWASIILTPGING